MIPCRAAGEGGKKWISWRAIEDLTKGRLERVCGKGAENNGISWTSNLDSGVSVSETSENI